MAFSGSNAPTTAAAEKDVRSPDGNGGRTAVLGEHVYVAVLGHEIAGSSRVGEERHRGRRAREDEMLGAGELLLGGFREIGKPFHGRHAGPALQPRREGFAEHLCTGRFGDANRRGQAGNPRRVSPDQQDRR